MLWETTFGRFRMYAIEDGFLLPDPLELLPQSEPAAWAEHPLVDGKVRIRYGASSSPVPTG
jgi:hypothetical protein